MIRRQVIVLVGLAVSLTAMSLRRIAQIPSGPYAGSVPLVCCDSDHDSMPELFFHTDSPGRVEAWEHRAWNRFSLVYADTGAHGPPPGITTGNAIPFAAGDIDNDGLTDIVCITVEPDSSNPDTVYDDVITIESPDSFSYPCSLSWYYRWGNNQAIPYPTYYPPDLDGDGHREIQMGGRIWENVGDDSNELVWTGARCGPYVAYGDFDMDGKMNLATGYSIMYVWECSGDDQYQIVYQDTVQQSNGYDVFTTNDIDGDGKPEFYVAYENVPRGKMYLYMWEADQVGTDIYHRTLVDSVSFSGTDWGRWSECGDIDADGVDECIWTTPNIIKMYKAVGDDQLQEVWQWNNDHGGFRSLVSTVYDINNDGYNELITAGNAKISIFEVDAVDLVSPNGGGCQPGDTVSIRWRVNTPPRCDSLSVFLRRGITPSPLPPPQGGGNEREGELTDSLWELDTIATGLPATDTLYQWIIPATVPDTGRVVVIAYGGLPPLSSNENGGCTQSAGKWGQSLGARGRAVQSPFSAQVAWQFDISDSIIDFTGGGVAEGNHYAPVQWSLSVSPNPARGAFTVRYDVPGKWGQSQPLRGQTEVQSPFSMSLGIYDAGGRLVRSLTQGDVVPGRYEVSLPAGTLPAGVYFCTLSADNKRFSRKVVLTE